MNKHTPGPWKAHKTNQARSGVPEFEIHWSDIGECVAEIVHGEADANLIAAAPDLLKLLVESQSFIGGDWRERRDAAVAKATGSAA